MSHFSVRALSAGELKQAVDWAGQEGWNPGTKDAECFRSTDPEGFLGGFLDGEMIACASAVNYDDAFSFLGFCLVKPEFRHNGHGSQIAQHALAHCEGRNVGLDCVLAQQDYCERSGFALANNNHRYGATIREILPKLGQVLGKGIAPVNDASDGLKAYDRQLFPASRDAFLQSWLGAPNHISRAYTENGQIRGYATLRPCRSGYKVGPLFADDAGIAQALLASLFAALPVEHRDFEVFVDMPQPNDAALALAGQLGLDKISETARMYSNHQPDIDLNRVFGVTTSELG